MSAKGDGTGVMNPSKTISVSSEEGSLQPKPWREVTKLGPNTHSMAFLRVLEMGIKEN